MRAKRLAGRRSVVAITPSFGRPILGGLTAIAFIGKVCNISATAY